MASLLCTHCTRRIYLRPRQLPPNAGLCVPCGHEEAVRQAAERAWHRFRDRLLATAAAHGGEPLRPRVDLRHLHL